MRFMGVLTTLAVGATVLAGCGDGEKSSPDPSRTVTIATHDSWAMPAEVLARFEEQSGINVKVQPHGDAGELTNKLVLTKDNPLADAVYGIDNTFASRAVAEGVLAEHDADRPGSAARFALDGEADKYLTPVDYSDVCINVDDTWFAKNGLTPPRTFDDLVDPAYEDLLVVPGATSSSPGLAFLVATIGTYGDDWKAYWSDLVENGVKIDAGWSDAYEVDFTAGGGKGDRPIVVSYSSSPPFTVPEGADQPTTSALLDTCFRQVEYAGVLDGADNPEGAQEFIDFMLEEAFQTALPEAMYVYPVDTTVGLPAGWKAWAPTAPDPVEVSAADITEHRADWLRDWRDITSR